MKLLSIVILFTISLSAQTTVLTKEEFRKELNKLTEEKSRLQKEKDELESFLKEKKEELNIIDKTLNECLEKSTNTSLSILTKKYGKDIALMISSGKIWKGMTIEMLRDSWGKPDSVNEDTFSYGTFTQLKYGDIEFFFRDKKLIDWEEKK